VPLAAHDLKPQMPAAFADPLIGLGTAVETAAKRTRPAEHEPDGLLPSV
jgi:hypothetical protein